MKFLLSNDVRRPIGFKILGIIFLLLVMMIVVTFSSNQNLKKLNNQLQVLSEYFIPLDQAIGDLRLSYSTQMLNFERVLMSGARQNLEPARQAGEKLAKEINSCSRRDMRKAMREAGPVFATEDSKNIALYEMQRHCNDSRISDTLKIVEAALSLPVVQKSPELTASFVKMQTQLAQLPRLRNNLHANILRYLSALSQGDAKVVALLEEQIETDRRLVSRETGRLARTLHDDTKNASLLATTLQRQASWFNWGMTIAAGLLGLFFAFLLTYNLVQPISKLMAGAKAMEKGDLNTNIQVGSSDEIALLADSFNHMVSELKAKEAIRETFGQYVDPRIVSKLLDQDMRKGEKQTMTIFFSDVEGFAKLSERLTPGGVVTLLNGYISAMAKCIRNNDGIIDKYIGDAIMAFWGPPFANEKEHAGLACLAALEQWEHLDEFRKTIPDLIHSPHGLPHFNVRMGICTGEVLVGSIGATSARSYTVIGDTVNIASRLESANKQYGTHLMIAEETFKMSADKIEARELDLVRVVGKSDPVRIYELLGRKGEVAPSILDARNAFEKGLVFYRKRDWASARACFEECLKLHPEDPPSKIFIERMEAFAANPPGEGWDSVWNLSEK